MIRVFFGVPESYGNSPGSIWAFLGHTRIEERGQKEGGLRPPSGPNWTRGAAPFSFFRSSSFLLSYSNKERRSPTPGGSRTPPLVRLLHRPAASPLAPIYMGAGGHPMTRKLIYGSFLCHVRCPPSTIFHLGHIVAEFRRSLVPVEHHHRHHAVVLMELIPEALLDRSPGIVIELNVC